MLVKMPIRDKKRNAKLVNAARATKLAPVPKWVAPKRRPKGDRFIFKPEVVKRSGYTFPTIWQLMIDGVFPRAVAVGGRSAWYASEFESWMASRPRRRLKDDNP
jgi:predicted DNA-binding transcriptional regulator AlpA